MKSDRISAGKTRRAIIAGLIGIPGVPRSGFAETESAKRPVPPGLDPSEIAGFDRLAEARQRLVRVALELRRRHGGLTYQYGGDSPEEGGFDCSGAVYFILRSAGFEPARSSAAQYLWLEKAGTIRKVPPEVKALDDPAFEHLKPGDLLFWSGTYEPTDGRTVPVSHVQMYLGRLRRDGRPVMIGASNGRSFGGTARNGFGVFDFRLPRAGSKAVFVGYGSPPGLPR